MFVFLVAVNDTANDFFHVDEETRHDQQKDNSKDKNNENNNGTSNHRDFDR